MISTLSGVVTEHSSDAVVIECAGVGYGVHVSISELSRLRKNDQAKLYIHEHIREDTHDLYGFVRISTKILFEQLLSVKNVGPKVALALLDIGNEDELRAAIAGGDVRLLQSAKGVGKRAAEQVVVELRDKVGALVTDEADRIASRAGIGTHDEAVQALVALGYTEADALTSLVNVDPALATEARVKLALRGKR